MPTSSDRDPLKDPRPGDQIRNGFSMLILSRTTHTVTFDVMEEIAGLPRTSTMSDYLGFAKDAKVVKRAE